MTFAEKYPDEKGFDDEMRRILYKRDNCSICEGSVWHVTTVYHPDGTKKEEYATMCPYQREYVEYVKKNYRPHSRQTKKEDWQDWSHNRADLI